MHLVQANSQYVKLEQDGMIIISNIVSSVKLPGVLTFKTVLLRVPGPPNRPAIGPGFLVSNSFVILGFFW
jgi:hypothetical protein